MFTIPEKINLANLPTRIQLLERASAQLGRSLYLKRDDETGVELSGNKVRKLEYAIAEAQRQGARVLITCGALQSNHARATAVAATKLGMRCVLVLMEGDTEPSNGNYLLDQILGAEIRILSKEDYSARLNDILEEIKAELDAKGEQAYILPIGASNGIGMFGYIEAIEEIMEQEKELGVHFDCIVDTVGSAGTYAGLVVGNALYKGNFDIIGISIAADAAYFRARSYEIIEECCRYLSHGLSAEITPQSLGITPESLLIIDAHRGAGYAQNTPEDYAFIRQFAQMEGIFLDPVYTGKAMKGLFAEVEAAEAGNPSGIGDWRFYKEILFLHTGGLYGLFPRGTQF